MNDKTTTVTLRPRVNYSTLRKCLDFGGHHCTARRTEVSLPLNSDIRESMIIALSCAADLPASRETLTSFSSSSFARVRKSSC